MSRPRLTPHQAEVFERIERYSKNRPTSERNIGSRTAVQHLIRKGYVTVAQTTYGPRGGATQYLTTIQTMKEGTPS